MRTQNDIGEILKEQGLIDLPAAEIGVAEGRFSRQILSWGVPHVYLVDIWASSDGGYGELTSWDDTTHEAMMQKAIDNLSGFEGRYTLLRGWSYEMCHEIEDESLGFVFVDASHDYENALRDLRCYWPKLVPNGLMSGHDWPIGGVQKAVKQFAKEEDLKINLLPLPSDPNNVSFWLERQ